MSGDMLEKAIARAARQWTWAWLALTASPVPRWATHPRFLVCCGFRYGFRACDELVIHGGWRWAGWTAGVELAKLQASHRKAGRCKIVDWVSTKTLHEDACGSLPARSGFDATCAANCLEARSDAAYVRISKQQIQHLRCAM